MNLQCKSCHRSVEPLLIPSHDLGLENNRITIGGTVELELKCPNCESLIIGLCHPVMFDLEEAAYCTLEDFFPQKLLKAEKYDGFFVVTIVFEYQIEPLNLGQISSDIVDCTYEEVFYLDELEKGDKR